MACSKELTQGGALFSSLLSADAVGSLLGLLLHHTGVHFCVGAWHYPAAERAPGLRPGGFPGGHTATGDVAAGVADNLW